MCKDYCGYHSNFHFKKTPWFRYKYALVGHSKQCPGNCTLENTIFSPNGDIYVDSAISILGHLLSETVTNPRSDAWYDDNSGNENADKCDWKYGKVFTQTNGE